MDLKHRYSKILRSPILRWLYDGGLSLFVFPEREGHWRACGLEIRHSLCATAAQAFARGKSLARIALGHRVMRLLSSDVAQRRGPSLPQVLNMSGSPARGSEELCAQS